MPFHSSAIIAGIAFVGSGTRVGYCFLAGEKSQFKSCNCSRGLQLKEKQRKHPWNEAEIRHKSRQLRKLSLVFWLFFLKTLKKRLNRESMPDLWKDLTRLSVQLNLSKQLGSWGIVNSLYIWKWTKTNLWYFSKSNVRQFSLTDHKRSVLRLILSLIYNFYWLDCKYDPRTMDLCSCVSKETNWEL